MAKLMKNMKSQHQNRKHNGFTLIELLVYLSITSVVLVVITSFVASTTKNAVESKVSTEIQQNARLLLSRMTYDIRIAEDFDDTNSDLNIDHGSLTVIQNAQPVSYSWDNGQVTLDDGSGPVALTTGLVNVTKFYFDRNGDTVTIQLTMEPKNMQASAPERSTISLSSTVTPRHLVY
ncbi:MAG: hypothetical protein UY52_C0019G0003 [Parcubacteria group bacterium GW2011_GWC2_49_9]|nr:MAG: hypothetical protein UY52_C0019G0003 [Parcubacteria group bacterium GW2011_GWC2_49_9]